MVEDRPGIRPVGLQPKGFRRYKKFKFAAITGGQAAIQKPARMYFLAGFYPFSRFLNLSILSCRRSLLFHAILFGLPATALPILDIEIQHRAD